MKRENNHPIHPPPFSDIFTYKKSSGADQELTLDTLEDDENLWSCDDE
jgi:hypothetical protein